MPAGVNARGLMLKSLFLRACPRSFPQLWKKMWKSHEIAPVSAGESANAPDSAVDFWHFMWELGFRYGPSGAKVGTTGQDARK